MPSIAIDRATSSPSRREGDGEGARICSILTAKSTGLSSGVRADTHRSHRHAIAAIMLGAVQGFVGALERVLRQFADETHRDAHRSGGDRVLLAPRLQHPVGDHRGIVGTLEY